MTAAIATTVPRQTILPSLNRSLSRAAFSGSCHVTSQETLAWAGGAVKRPWCYESRDGSSGLTRPESTNDHYNRVWGTTAGANVELDAWGWATWVEEQRHAGLMRNDDTTLVIIRVDLNCVR